MVVPSIVVYARNNFGAPETGLVETGPTVLVATALEQPIATYSSVITRMETTHGPTSSWLQQCNHIGNMKRWQLHFVDDRPFCSLAWKMKTNFTVLHLYITCWHIIVNATLSISMCTLTLHLNYVDSLEMWTKFTWLQWLLLNWLHAHAATCSDWLFYVFIQCHSCFTATICQFMCMCKVCSGLHLEVMDFAECQSL